MSTSASDAPMFVDRSINAHVGYRADLDGLRALAALSVVAAHSFPDLKGGTTGVDMFFVLSRFLISGILLRALLQGKFSFSDFYARRIRRIFPALIVVLLAVWLIGSVLLLPEEYRGLGKDIATGASFSLYIFWQLEQQTYPLEIDFGGMLLSQLWSLGVEEQFYLLWPLFLVTIWRLSKERIQYVAAATASVMLTSFTFLMAMDSDRGIGQFVCRGMWELSAGALVACVQLGNVPTLNRIRSIVQWLPYRQAAGVVAAVLFYVAIVGDPSDSFLVNSWTIAPALGTVLLISSGPSTFISKYIFSAAPMTLIGRISYPLYLWHFPILLFVLMVTWNRAPSSSAIFTVVTVASLVLAFLTYKFVELPIRFRAGGKTVGLLVGLMVVSGAVGMAIFLGGIRPLSYFYGGDAVRSMTEDWLQDSGSDSWTKDSDRVRTLGSGPQHALFIGDSNMQQYYPRIEKLVASGSHVARGAIFATRFGCAPGVVEVHLGDKREKAACRQYLGQALAYAADPSVDVVVIAAAWYVNAVEIQALDRIGQVAPLKSNVNLAIEDLEKTLSALTASGKRVYLVLNLPVGARFDPRAHVGRTRFVAAPDPTDYTRRDKIMTALQPITSRLREVAQKSGARTIDPLESLCDAVHCPSHDVSGRSMYHDLWHLRPSYVRDHVKYLDALIREP